MHPRDDQPAGIRERHHAIRWMFLTVVAFVPAVIFFGLLIGWIVVTATGSRAGRPLRAADWMVFAACAAGAMISMGMLRRRAAFHYGEMRRARNEQVSAALRAAALGDRTLFSAGRERQMFMGLVPAVLTAIGIVLALWLIL